MGYAGTSHKNCKGIVKGLTNAATVFCAQRAGKAVVLSAEDLGNIGPLALTQDLAVAACLNIDHIERNGHHYFAGLSMFPAEEQQRTSQKFGDLYCRSEGGFPSLNIQDGRLNVRDVNSAAFGGAPLPDVELFEAWSF